MIYEVVIGSSGCEITIIKSSFILYILSNSLHRFKQYFIFLPSAVCLTVCFELVNLVTTFIAFEFRYFNVLFMEIFAEI